MQCLQAFSSILGVLLLSQTAYPLVQKTGTTFELNGVPYYVPPSPLLTISGGWVPNFAGRSDGLLPMTVVNIDTLQYGTSDLQKQVATFGQEDDVWQQGFLQVIYAQYNGSRPSGSLRPNLSAFPMVMSPPPGNKQFYLANGPYFFNPLTGGVYTAYRLYSDYEGAFTETLITNRAGNFSVLPAYTPGQELAVAVPSRLYYTKSPQKPLAGVRTGIKDIYDIAGIRTGDGNRAWYHFYPPASANSVAVQRLVDAGAVIVRKMKTSQFANGERPTVDWVDYLEPFNPRGDGYQDTSSSSAGPGSREAAYPWLDITLGSDTGGSIRQPGAVQGLYGNRPSYGLVSLDGVMPLAPNLTRLVLLYAIRPCGRLPHRLCISTMSHYQPNTRLKSSQPAFRRYLRLRRTEFF